jgi:hypothetical protein
VEPPPAGAGGSLNNATSRNCLLAHLHAREPGDAKARDCSLIRKRNQNVKKIISPLFLSVLIFFVLNTAASPAGMAICGSSGEILFKKHCSACHRDAPKLKAVKNIAEIIRNPLAVMPAFDKNKISDLCVKEIADYIYQGSDFSARAKKQ